MDPSCDEFQAKYALESMKEEEIVNTIRLRQFTRNTYMTVGFVSYMVVKIPLQWKGYGAHFFHRTRFLPVPSFFVAIWYSSFKLHKS